jgi:hypothetical protein
MPALSTYLGNLALNSYIGPRVLDSWACLYTTSVSASGSGTEVTGGSYARINVFGSAWWNTASNMTMYNNQAIVFTGLPATTITHFALRTASSGGNLLWYGTLDAPITTLSGDSLGFATSNVYITME